MCDGQEAVVASVVSSKNLCLDCVVHLELCQRILLVLDVIPRLEDLGYRDASLHVLAESNVELSVLDRPDANICCNTKLDVCGGCDFGVDRIHKIFANGLGSLRSACLCGIGLGLQRQPEKLLGLIDVRDLGGDGLIFAETKLGCTEHLVSEL